MDNRNVRLGKQSYGDRVMLRILYKQVKDTKAPRYLKIGQRVKIKPLSVVNSVLEKGYNFPLLFAEKMKKYCGRSAVVVDSKVVSDTIIAYRLDIDKRAFVWSTPMFDWESNLMRNE
jgi:hypothetical protein